MEIRKNTWHSKLYKIIYNKLSDNLCEYFWKLVLAILLLPFTWVALCIPKFRKDEDMGMGSYLLVGTVVYGFFSASWGFGSDFFPNQTLILQILFGVVFFTLIALLLGLIFGVCVLICYIYDKTQETPKRTNIVTERLKAFKGKYCPKITWK